MITSSNGYTDYYLKIYLYYYTVCPSTYLYAHGYINTHTFPDKLQVRSYNSLLG